MVHKFHIPVLGLGFSIDTPLKVAKYGISSVVSVVDDELIERMRKYHTEKNNLEFIPIAKKTINSRAKRITSYLNFMNNVVKLQFYALQELPFEHGNDLCRYFELLPSDSQLRLGYELMMDYPEGERKRIFQNILKKRMVIGSIDVNIMAKVDNNSDALAALRGFAESDLTTSVVLSAGMNPKLYSYISEFDDFFPNRNGVLKKRIILKVSDFRSAFIQAKFLAKKGLWVSEFRIESGLNCGGHAFATEGYLLGPILEEFKQNKSTLLAELFDLYCEALAENPNRHPITPSITLPPKQLITVQGGIGTSSENDFLLKHYQLDATGWGSPFLLVPEVTNVDGGTLENLVNASEEDYYLSNSSPLGVLFNNFKGSTIEQERLSRLEKGRPGSPCTKKYLCTNTEFTEKPICTASREYQNLKINQLANLQLPKADYERQFNIITEKICLCEGLCTSVYLKNEMSKPKESAAVAICPGPNLAYFSATYTLQEMVSHIYGQLNLLEKVKRPHFFIKELNLYIEYLQKDIQNHLNNLSDKKIKQLIKFKTQLLAGVDYYKSLFRNTEGMFSVESSHPYTELLKAENKLANTFISDLI
ncbi:hypothetical protein WG904_11545 [Pedobacter sp. Du54]|uniref:hypothetical protein n=1 Tax=Pedobacter anseongensis TaxID=3133439 RepID=UPI00309F77EC